jgi:two-component system, NtrC family, nitrogen regulation sensor histidine kinase NtrY
MPRGDSRPVLTYEGKLGLMALAAGIPGSMIALLLLWLGGFSAELRWTCATVILTAWVGFSLAARGSVVYTFRTISNLLAALREGDFSVRGKEPARLDARNEVVREINMLGATLREQRLGAVEANTLLRIVMSEIDVAIFAFDENRCLRLANRAGERLMGAASDSLRGRSAGELGLAHCLDGEPRLSFQQQFHGKAGWWGMRRTVVREQGRPLQLLVLSDVTEALRDQELQAWQRLVRVLGHELNNSLTPIKSIADSVRGILAREPLPEDWREDSAHGLSIITSRADGLSRFIGAYARLAKLPTPSRQPLEIRRIVESAVRLETRSAIAIAGGPDTWIEADPDQIEQVLINLARNAVDAALITGGAVRTGWSASADTTEIWIEDEGPGLAGTSNLFVPFFTTKAGGSGIGLVLSRQIAERHGGALTLENRTGAIGCVARLKLPIS